MCCTIVKTFVAQFNDRAKLRLGHAILFVNLLAIILTVVGLRSNFYHRETKAKGSSSQFTKEDTSITLWKMIHCVHPVVPPTAAPLATDLPEAVTGENATAKVTEVPQQAKNDDADGGSLTGETGAGRQTYCTFDTIASDDISWPAHLVETFHGVMGLLVVVFTLRLLIFFFFWLVGGNALKFTGSNEEEEDHERRWGKNSSFATTTSTSGGSFSSTSGNHNLRRTDGRVHTCEGFIVLGAALLLLTVEFLILFLIVYLSSIADMHGAHLSRTNKGMVTDDTATSNSTLGADADADSTPGGSTYTGFVSMGFSKEFGTTCFILLPLLEIVLFCIAVVFYWFTRKAQDGNDILTMRGGKTIKSSRKSSRLHALEDGDCYYEMKEDTVALDTELLSKEDQNQLKPHQEVKQHSIDFDTSLSPQYSEIVTRAVAPQTYVPPTVASFAATSVAAVAGGPPPACLLLAAPSKDEVEDKSLLLEVQVVTLEQQLAAAHAKIAALEQQAGPKNSQAELLTVDSL